MNIDFSSRKIELVVVPQDLRYGFKGLTALAQDYLNINIFANEHYVVFISKSRAIAKIIGHDEYGSILITRALDKGRYQQLLSDIDEGSSKKLTTKMLENYLDGKDLQIKRESLL